MEGSFYKISGSLEYMNEKCKICGEELQTTFLDKLNGTVVKTGKGENSKKVYVCFRCQKEHKDNLVKFLHSPK